MRILCNNAKASPHRVQVFYYRHNDDASKLRSAVCKLPYRLRAARAAHFNYSSLGKRVSGNPRRLLLLLSLSQTLANFPPKARTQLQILRKLLIKPYVRTISRTELNRENRPSRPDVIFDIFVLGSGGRLNQAGPATDRT